ncbi:hypothetical protein PI124_g3945, partial [Phytophthora idaei]
MFSSWDLVRPRFWASAYPVGHAPYGVSSTQ